MRIDIDFHHVGLTVTTSSVAISTGAKTSQGWHQLAVKLTTTTISDGSLIAARTSRSAGSGGHGRHLRQFAS